MTKEHILSIYSKQYFHLIYRWAGNVEYCPRLDAVVADCSGLILKILADAGIVLPDLSSQGIYYYCQKHGKGSGVEAGNLLFYGKDENSITHIALALSEDHILEMGGSGRESLKMTKEDLIKKDARTRIRPFGHRRDFLCGIKII